jgi:hypothetical protein
MNARRIFATALRSGLPFGVAIGAFQAVQHHNVVAAVAGGLVGGAMFGGVMGVFVELQRKKLMIPGDRFEGEPILHQGPANHWRGAEARGGWLILTSERLAFRSHGKNIQNQSVDVRLADVRGVEPTNTLFFVPNGLRVLRDHGESDKFVVSERALWLERLGAAVKARG